MAWAVEFGLQLVCSFALSVIVSLSESGKRTSHARFGPIEALTELSETLLTLLSGLRIPAAVMAGDKDME